MAGAERQTKLEIELGDEQVELIRLEATEGLAQPFFISVELLATLGEFDLLPHLGKTAAVSVLEDDVLLRHFHGTIVEGEYLHDHDGRAVYRLTLRPKTHLMENNRNYRIFQDKTVRQILEEVFAEHSIDVDYGQMSGGARKRSYCVQYGESDFGFLSRLMEEEGIYYFFRHSEAKHEMVLCDEPGSHVEGAASPLVFNPTGGSAYNTDSAAWTAAEASEKFIQRWHERVSSYGEQTVTSRDWNFMQPNKPLEVTTAEEGQHNEDAVEVYQFPGRFYNDSDGMALSKTLLRSRRINRKTYAGESQTAAITCGATFTMKEHPHDRFNTAYLIVRAYHTISSETHRSGGAAGGDNSGTVVRIEAVPADTHWQAPQTSRRPIVHGPETAIVTGSKDPEVDEEIYTDKYGRIKVRFHWDRVGGGEKDSSCWIRVSQTGGLGNIILPRVGHEVLVDFINGDPDRPIVVGRVFNERHMPTYALPANKTRAVWRTKAYGTADRAHEGGSMKLDTDNPGANEIRHEDKMGHEEFFVHAQRDYTQRVRHKETHHVGLDQEMKVGQDRNKDIKRDEFVHIGRDRKTKIDQNEILDITGKRETKIAQTELLDVKQTIKIEAGTKIELIVGSSKITIDQMQIKLESMSLNFESSMNTKMKSLMTSVSATSLFKAESLLITLN